MPIYRYLGLANLSYNTIKVSYNLPIFYKKGVKMSEFSFYFREDEFVIEATKTIKKTPNGTLVFRNKMNSILFPVNFTARDYDVFFTICWYAKQMGYAENRGAIEMPYSEIAKFYEKDINKTRFNNEIKIFRDKVLGRNGAAIYRTVEFTEDDEISSVGVFFIDIDVFRNKQILRFRLNPRALDILFKTLNFMKIDLYDFVSINGKFAKTLYRLLHQYDNLKPDKDGFKCVKFTRFDFENLMSVPIKYDSTDLNRRVIEPSVNELNEKYFKKLMFEREFSKKNKKEITGYSFKFMLNEQVV